MSGFNRLKFNDHFLPVAVNPFSIRFGEDNPATSGMKVRGIAFCCDFQGLWRGRPMTIRAIIPAVRSGRVVLHPCQQG